MQRLLVVKGVPGQQQRALEVLRALVERCVAVRKGVTANAVWERLLVALASSEAAAPDPETRSSAMEALCDWSEEALSDSTYARFEQMRDEATDKGAVVPPLLSRTKQHTDAPSEAEAAQKARKALTDAKKARLAKGGVVLDEVDAAGKGLRAIVAAGAAGLPKTQDGTAQALTNTLKQAQKKIARLLAAEDVLADPDLVTVLLGLNTRIVCSPRASGTAFGCRVSRTLCVVCCAVFLQLEELTRYDAFLVRCSPVRDTASSSQGSQIGSFWKKLSSLSASFSPLRRKEEKKVQALAASSPQKKEPTPGESSVSPEPKQTKPKLQPPKSGQQPQEAAAQGAVDGELFDPDVEFSRRDELQRFATVLPAESSDDFLERPWHQKHTEEDCLRASYVALFKNDDV